MVLTGTIPSQLGVLAALAYLPLSNNQYNSLRVGGFEGADVSEPCV